MDDITNRRRRESNDERKRTHSESLTHYVLQLATIMGQELTTERLSLYVAALDSLSDKQVEFGFKKAIDLFKPEFGKVFPYPAEIRELAEQYQPVEIAIETQKLLDRPDKPTDWVRMGARIGVTKDEIAQWLQAGKNRALAHFAELEKDPKFREERRLSRIIPGMAAKSMPSAIPSEPLERAPWARMTARAQGWITDAREPGEEG